MIGFGSIGSRHHRILGELGLDVAVVCRRETDVTSTYGEIGQGVSAFQPDLVVLASKTCEHRDDIRQISDAGFSGRLLVEKPLYDRGSEPLPHDFAGCYVAFNLRFHPALLRFRELVGERKVASVHAYCGSYLPDWRPDRDYREGYSAKRDLGGGVLRDLSHEIDYLQWIFGDICRLSAMSGCYGNLEIDSDDVASVLFETAKVPVLSLQLNYLDTKTRREVIALTDDGTVRLDLVAGEVETRHGTEQFDVARDDTYRAQHRAFIEGNDSVLCRLDEGLGVMRAIDAIERAAVEQAWVRL